MTTLKVPPPAIPPFTVAVYVHGFLYWGLAGVVTTHPSGPLAWPAWAGTMASTAAASTEAATRRMGRRDDMTGSSRRSDPYGFVPRARTYQTELSRSIRTGAKPPSGGV